MASTEPLLSNRASNSHYDSTNKFNINNNTINTTKINVQSNNHNNNHNTQDSTVYNTISQYIPMLRWLPNYKTEYLLYDIIAGVSVSCILIPQALSFSALANLPAIYGVYTSIYPCVIYAIFGTSQYLHVGIEATSSILLGKTIVSLPNIQHIDVNSIEYIEQCSYNAMSLTLLVGLIALCMGIVKLGFLDGVLSRVALHGFVNGIAIVITIGQLPNLLGIHIKNNTSYSTLELLYETLSRIHLEINFATALISVLCLVILLSIKQIKHKYSTNTTIQMIPELLIVCTLSITLCYIFDIQSIYHVSTLDTITMHYQFAIPTLATGSLVQLFSSAITIIILGLTESMLVSKKYATLQHTSIDANQEFCALGIVSMIGSLFGAYCAFGSLTRSKIAYTLHAKTQLYSVVTACSIVVVITLLAPTFSYLPKATTSSIVCSIAISLLDIHELVYIYKIKCYSDLCLCIAMTLITVLFGVDVSILFGIIVCMFIIVKQSAQPNITVVQRQNNHSKYLTVNHKNYDSTDTTDTVIVYRIDAVLYHANSEKLKDTARTTHNTHRYATCIVLDCTGLVSIDSTGLHVVYEIIQFYHEHKVRVVVCGVPNRELIKSFKSANIFDLLQQNNIYKTYEQCMESLTGNIVKNSGTHMSNDSIDMLNTNSSQT